jgi:hypothetical protein
MTWHKVRAQPEPKWGRSAPSHWVGGQVLASFQLLLYQCVRRVGARGIQCLKLVEAELGGLKSMVELTHSTYIYPIPPSARWRSESEV